MSDENSASELVVPIRAWPEGVEQVDGLARRFVERYKKAFDADPLATFCAGELDGVVLVIATGNHAAELRALVECAWSGRLERVPPPSSSSRSEHS